MLKISVLTPTYNRAKLLENLYKSLLENKDENIHIEWLIMDDGSTDNTEKVINNFLSENKLEIKYFKQTNQGKMQAINNLIPLVSGDLIIECDSDDYFTSDAFELIKEEYDKKDNSELYAFCFLKNDQNGNNMGKDLKDEKTTMFDLYFKKEENGEKALVYFADIRKKYSYKLEKNEKFVTEARLHHEMDLKYKIKCVNKPIMICEYQKEGYTKNIKDQFVQNPYGYLEYFKEILKRTDLKGITLNKRLYVIKHYILFNYLTENKLELKYINGLLNKLLVVLLFIPGKIKSKREFGKYNKLLFSAYSLEIGGIEKALVDLLNELIKKYNVTLVLEENKGKFLEKIDKKINTIEYKPSNNKNLLFRKISNFIKQFKFILKYKNKFQFSASFATYSRPGSFCARTASKNSFLWVHSDYVDLYGNNKEKIVNFFNDVKYNKFYKIIMVSEKSRNSLIEVLKNIESKSCVINNLINYEEIKKLSSENINFERNKNEIIFLNVGRHDEESKKLTRLISATKKLKDEGYNFKVILVGAGKDTNTYKDEVRKNKLEDVIIFLGEKKNPYPYFNICDCVIMTSDHEGYPVVFNETRVLNKPIITTDVSDSLKDIKNKYGIVVDKSDLSIYKAMKMYIDNGYEIKEEFDCVKYNNEILKNIEEFIKGEL